MIRNFSTEEDIYLVIDKIRHDIHSDFLLKSFSYDASSQEVLIRCDSAKTGKGIKLLFSGIRTIKLKEADSAYPRKEARFISFIGFLGVDDVEKMDGFLPDDGSSDVDLIIGVQDGSAIKVGANEVVAIYE